MYQSATASEVLQFEAGLHLPTHLSAADRRCCWEVLALMGLVKSAHTLVSSRGGTSKDAFLLSPHPEFITVPGGYFSTTIL